MFKKSMMLVAAVCILSGFAYAENAKLAPLMDKGTFAANAGLSFGWGIGLGGGAEYVLARVDIAEVLPLTFGAAGRGYFSAFGTYSVLDIAAMGTIHVGFKGLDLPEDLKRWIDPIDYYAGLGLGYNVLGNDYWADRFPLGFATMSGASYFLNDNLAINFEGGSMGGYWGYGMIGVLYKF